MTAAYVGCIPCTASSLANMPSDGIAIIHQRTLVLVLFESNNRGPKNWPGKEHHVASLPHKDIQPVAPLRTEDHGDPGMRIELNSVCTINASVLWPQRKSTGRVAIRIGRRCPATIMPTPAAQRPEPQPAPPPHRPEPSAQHRLRPPLSWSPSNDGKRQAALTKPKPTAAQMQPKAAQRRAQKVHRRATTSSPSNQPAVLKALPVPTDASRTVDAR